MKVSVSDRFVQGQNLEQQLLMTIISKQLLGLHNQLQIDYKLQAFPLMSLKHTSRLSKAPVIASQIVSMSIWVMDLPA